MRKKKLTFKMQNQYYKNFVGINAYKRLIEFIKEATILTEKEHIATEEAKKMNRKILKFKRQNHFT